jgi:hypothetical protein
VKRLVASLFAVSLLFVVSPAEVHAVDCDAAIATYLPISEVPQPISFYGDNIGEQQMAVLWDLGMKWNTHDFGKVIAAEQNWFGECKYPGIGLATGSGYSWHDRNVTLWIWADGVDLAQAVSTIHSLLQPTPVTTTSTSTTSTTTTSTTTTTLAPTTSTTSSTTTLPPAPVDEEPATTTSTTTTTTVAPEPELIAVTQVISGPVSSPPAETTTTTTTTIAPMIAVSYAAAVAPAVKIASPAVQKKVVKKIVKKKVVKKKVKVNGNR